MEQILLKIKDKSKIKFLLELLDLFDFVEIQKSIKKRKTEISYDFFESAGLWKDRDINADRLRIQAWKRNN